MASYQFADPVKTSKGGIIIPLLAAKTGADVTWLLDEETSVPWTPSNMSDPESSRLNMCFHPTAQIEALCADLDKWAVAELTKHSKKLLGKEMTTEQVKAMYQPSLKTSQKGCRHLKTKLQLGTGRSCTKFWDHQGKRTGAPDDFMECSFKANVVIRHLYVMPKECGFVVEIKDLRLRRMDLTCPFAQEAEAE
jgi:hypothetical protein